MESTEAIARRVVDCNFCFTNLGLQRTSADDLAQPRFIGKNYWAAKPKVVVVMTNPGAGDNKDQGIHKQRRDLLKNFLNGAASLDEVFKDQFADMFNWGHGQFMSYFVDSLRLSFDSVALLNIAWCATKGDSYPKRMFNECFTRHTESALKLFAPDAVLLSGGEAQGFHLNISTAVPGARIFHVRHYAHRGGTEEANSFNSDWLKFWESEKC